MCVGGIRCAARVQIVAGSYRGEIRLAVWGDTILVQPLVVDVLPFVLPRFATVCSIYYYSPSATYYGDAVMQQYRREMENLRDHGVLDVMHPYSAENEEALRIRREVGMSESSILFYRGWLADVRQGDINADGADCDAIRAQIIALILALN